MFGNILLLEMKTQKWFWDFWLLRHSILERTLLYIRSFEFNSSIRPIDFKPSCSFGVFHKSRRNIDNITIRVSVFLVAAKFNCQTNSTLMYSDFITTLYKTFKWKKVKFLLYNFKNYLVEWWLVRAMDIVGAASSTIDSICMSFRWKLHFSANLKQLIVFLGSSMLCWYI